jgi:hypothetical protein
MLDWKSQANKIDLFINHDYVEISFDDVQGPA